MRKFIFTLLLSLAAISAAFATKTEETKNLILEPSQMVSVSTVHVNMPSNIYFVKSEHYGIRIRTDIGFLNNYIKYYIKNNTLYITLNSRFLSETYNISPDNIKIYIMTPNETINVKTNNTLVVSNNRNLFNIGSYETN